MANSENLNHIIKFTKPTGGKPKPKSKTDETVLAYLNRKSGGNRSDSLGSYAGTAKDGEPPEQDGCDL